MDIQVIIMYYFQCCILHIEPCQYISLLSKLVCQFSDMWYVCGHIQVTSKNITVMKRGLGEEKGEEEEKEEEKVKEAN